MQRGKIMEDFTVSEAIKINQTLKSLINKLNGDDNGLLQELKTLAAELKTSSVLNLKQVNFAKDLQKILDEQFKDFQHNDTLLKGYLKYLNDTVDKRNDELNNAVDKAKEVLNSTVEKANEDLKEKYKNINLDIISEKGKIAKFLTDEQLCVSNKLKKELDDVVDVIDNKMITFKKDIKIDEENRAKPLKIINYANLAIGVGLGLVVGVLGTFFMLSSHLVR